MVQCSPSNHHDEEQSNPRQEKNLYRTVSGFWFWIFKLRTLCHFWPHFSKKTRKIYSTTSQQQRNQAKISCQIRKPAQWFYWFITSNNKTHHISNIYNAVRLLTVLATLLVLLKIDEKYFSCASIFFLQWLVKFRTYQSLTNHIQSHLWQHFWQ